MPLPKVDGRTDEQRAKHNERMKRYYANHPEQRQIAINRIKERYATDPEFRERVKTQARERKQRLKDTKTDDSESTTPQEPDSNSAPVANAY